jgi:hypothetical protein
LVNQLFDLREVLRKVKRVIGNDLRLGNGWSDRK